jgi:Zn-dependent metalloprotease
MMAKKLLSVFLFLFLIQHIKAQIFEGAEADRKLPGSEILRLNETTGKIKYALLGNTLVITKEQTLPYLSKVLGFSSLYNLQLTKEEHDELGFDHLRFQQTFNNVPILGGIVIAHIKNNRLHSFNGEVFDVNEK